MLEYYETNLQTVYYFKYMPPILILIVTKVWLQTKMLEFRTENLFVSMMPIFIMVKGAQSSIL